MCMHMLVKYEGKPVMSFIRSFQYLYFLVSLAATWGSLVSLPSQKIYMCSEDCLQGMCFY